MGVHEIIYGLIGLLLAYLCWLVFRFFSLRSKAARKMESPRFDEPVQDAETIGGAILGGEMTPTSSSVSFDSSRLDDYSSSLGSARERRTRTPPEPDASVFGFDALLEVRQMHHSVDELRQELAAQRAEIEALKETLGEVRAASQVSPLYGEAVALAHRGYDAQAIAERCGISVAEAELVRSLSQDKAKQEPEHG